MPAAGRQLRDPPVCALEDATCRRHIAVFDYSTPFLLFIKTTQGELCSSCVVLERMKGVEPSCSAWEADVLPMNYTRVSVRVIQYSRSCRKFQSFFCRRREFAFFSGGKLLIVGGDPVLLPSRIACFLAAAYKRGGFSRPPLRCCVYLPRRYSRARPPSEVSRKALAMLMPVWYMVLTTMSKVMDWVS